MYSGRGGRMIRLQLNGEMVVGLPLEVSPDYQPKDNEVVVNKMPHVSLENNQIAYIYYRNGQIEYEVVTK